MKLRHLHSFMLYSSREFPPLADQATALAALGYTNVEVHPELGVDPEDTRAIMSKAGLDICSAHFDVPQILNRPQEVADIAHRLGASFVVAPWLWPEERPTDRAGWLALADQLSASAAVLEQQGLRLCWHNHDFEFEAFADGGTPYAVLAATPGLYLELDVGWIFRAGDDPVAWIDRVADRVLIAHMKDVAPEGTEVEDGWADLGHGEIDWTPVYAALQKAPVELLIVEHDEPADYLRFARNSAASMARITAGGAA